MWQAGLDTAAKITVCVNFFSLSEHKFTQTAIMTSG
jgi:hypothetical protein